MSVICCCITNYHQITTILFAYDFVGQQSGWGHWAVLLFLLGHYRRCDLLVRKLGLLGLWSLH